MRIVFCGSGSFAGPALRAIRQAGHELVRVVTQPARPSGRGGKVLATPLAQVAAAEGLQAVETVNINAPESVAAIAAAAPDVIVVVDFGQMVRAAVRQCARLSAFNLHGSLLPPLRGAAPVNWAIIRGLAETGVTTFELVDKMDAGDIYLQAKTPISPSETAEELRLRLAEIGAKLVVETIEHVAAGKKGVPQDESLSTLAPKLTKEDGWIDWTADAAAIRNRIHGVWPWPAGQAILHRATGAPLPVLIARASAEDCGAGVSPAQPGVFDKNLLVGAGSGRVRILEIQPAGKKLMPWKAFVNGYRPSPGDRLVSPTHE